MKKPGVALMRPAPLAGSRLVDLSGRSLTDDLTQRGFNVFDIAPTEHKLTNIPRPDVKEDAYLFSSATALEALAMSGQKLNLDLPALAVGAQTADAARHFGFTNIIAGDGGLVHLMEDSRIPSSGTVLYVAVDQPRHDLNSAAFQTGLSLGYRDRFVNLHIHHWAIYETGATNASTFRKQIRSNLFQIRYLSFFSYRNASSFAQILGQDAQSPEPGFDLRDKIATCFSTQIAECLQNIPFRSVELVSKPNRKAYLALMDTLETAN